MSKAGSQANEWYADGLRFSCTQCGRCCTGPTGFVWYTPEEGMAMARFLNMSFAKFEKQYTRRLGSRRSLNEYKTRYGYDCVFLTRDENGKAGCSIYSVRPSQCRTWPFWPENLASPEDYAHVADTCPGVKKGINGQGEFVPIEEIRIRRDQSRG